jgi:hypothetical protein
LHCKERKFPIVFRANCQKFAPKKKTKATDSAIFLMKFCHLATKIKEPATFAKGFSPEINPPN